MINSIIAYALCVISILFIVYLAACILGFLKKIRSYQTLKDFEDSNDEIYTVYKNLEKIFKEKEENLDFIAHSSDMLKQMEQGIFSKTLSDTSTNSDIQKFILSLNNVSEKINTDFQKIVDMLIQYSKANFIHKVDTNNISGKTGSIILGIKALGDSISELMAVIDLTSINLNEKMKHLTDASSSLATSSSQQAAFLEEVAASIEEISSNIAQNSENSFHMSQVSKEVSTSIKEGESLAVQTVKSMDEIHHEVHSINDSIEIIDQIAFQTNILSLNAAVEAATAGEAGKGFAVVAQEVRNLATRSAETAKDIKNIVEKAALKANSGKQNADKMIDGFHILSENINKTIHLVDDVSLSCKEQHTAIEQINDSINELDKTTQENATAATQISSEAKDIESLSNNLLSIINQAQYDKQAQNQISDMNLAFKLNDLKLDHIKFKDTNYDQLGSNKKWKVKTCKECNLGKWMMEQEQHNMIFTQSKNWQDLTKYHYKVHNEVQNIIDNNSENNLEYILENSSKIDDYVEKVFESLQIVKVENSSS